MPLRGTKQSFINFLDCFVPRIDAGYYYISQKNIHRKTTNYTIK
jgi:hypothetical protein